MGTGRGVQWEERLTLDQLVRVDGVMARYNQDGLLTVALEELQLNGMTRDEAVNLLLIVDLVGIPERS